MQNKPEQKTMDNDYPLIPMNDITDEARKIAVRWHENATDWIGDKHKLASDIMNYARRTNSQRDQSITALTDKVRKQEEERKQSLLLYQNMCNQIAKDNEEIERLKELIEKMYNQYVETPKFIEERSPAVLIQLWQKFKTDNQL